MVEAGELLKDLRRLLRRTEDDLRAHLEVTSQVDADLRAEHDEARAKGRTAAAYEPWRDERITQAGVAWLLSCVFVRFVEDNDLIEERFLAGRGDGWRRAQDTQTAFFQDDPHCTDREYLLHAFETVGALPGMDRLFHRQHNLVFRIPVSADGASEILAFWRTARDDVAPSAPVEPVHDFHHLELDTRFLGDLYQELDAEARDRYALFQTPEFVEELILDRTLYPAIATFGLESTRMLDPTCGSGHFLLGGFHRILKRWRKAEPGTEITLLVQRALDQVAGVDINPYAVAIARFRLLVAALRATGITRLCDAPAYSTWVATGDSLLRDPQQSLPGMGEDVLASHGYMPEDGDLLDKILDRQYEVVVGNPPYPTVEDKALNKAYRKRYANVCYRRLVLSVPFVRRFFDLAREGRGGQPAGYVGQITSNSFMRRVSGKRLVEDYLPRQDLTLVVDTSGAYIPSHGTPTALLFARRQLPATSAVQMVLGIRNEPSKPSDPAKGLVWQAILATLSDPDANSLYVSTTSTSRAQLAKHPWNIGGGGAAAIKERIDSAGTPLALVVDELGYTGQTNVDDAMLASTAAHRRAGMPHDLVRPLVTGEVVRDWRIGSAEWSWFPYRNESLINIEDEPVAHRRLWPYRTAMWSRATFGGGTYRAAGRTWWEWHQVSLRRLRTPRAIAFPLVATHNHFVLDRSGLAFKQAAPMIKLSEAASDEQHLHLLGLLNSSVAGFWARQMCQPKPSNGVKRGLESEHWTVRYVFDTTKMQQFPVLNGGVVEFSRRLDSLANEVAEITPAGVCQRGVPTREALDTAHNEGHRIRALQIAAQEELDWRCLYLYGLVVEDLSLPLDEVPPLKLGERAFEVVLAREIEAQTEDSVWFTRHRSTPITELPAHWPESYRRTVERRIEMITTDRNVGLVERPEHKRRWATEPWDVQVQSALREWLLDRLEDRALWYDGDQPRSLPSSRLTDLFVAHPDNRAVLELFAGATADPASVVEKLVLSDAVPAVATARYTDDGLKKRRVWERTWDLQREEDTKGIDLDIPVPPKYKSVDLRSKVYWDARGKLDVPKERFVLYPAAQREGDASPVLGWAGWDHLEQVTAAATLSLERQEVDGWDAQQLRPLLAVWDEVLPWVKQWHNEPDPRTGRRLGDFFAGQLTALLHELGLTRDDLLTWAPPATGRGRGRGRKPAASSAALTLDGVE